MELINHRKENGNYKGAFKGKSKGSKGDKNASSPGLTKEEEAESKAERTGLIEALRGVIQAEVADGLGKAGGVANAGTKRLRAASAAQCL